MRKMRDEITPICAIVSVHWGLFRLSRIPAFPHSNNALVSGGQLNANEPQALIYEPVGKAMKLVGVEFIAIADPWLTAHQQAPPVLEGQLLQYIGAPNRYGLPGLFELHVWAWRDNPHGAYVDWNTHVTCEEE
jgi:hypothetical protein